MSNEFVDISTNSVEILSRNTFIHIYGIITKKWKFLIRDRTWASCKCLLTKILARLWHMRNRTLKSAGRLLCVRTLGRFGTIHAEDQSNNKRAYKRILTFGTAQSNTLIVWSCLVNKGPVWHSRLSPTALAPPRVPPPDLRRPQRVLRHEKLWNYVTWPAWENWNVFQFNWCLYSN